MPCAAYPKIEIALENLLLLTDARTARVLITAPLFALVLAFLYVTRQTLIAFLFAIFFAYLMSPLVSPRETAQEPRPAIAVIYTLLLGLVVVFFVLMGPKVTREGTKLGQSLPALLNQLSSGQLAEQLGEEHGWNFRTTELAKVPGRNSDAITQMAQRVGLRVADVAKQAWMFLVVPILSSFFSKTAAPSATSCFPRFNHVRNGSFWKVCSTISTRCSPISSAPS